MSAPEIRVDIISDVMCPWCIIGYLQLEQAMRQTGIGVGLRWHPFELNPEMPPEGQNMTEHIVQKYGSTPEKSARSRDQITALGAQLGFTFNFGPDSRMVNSFRAHQIIDWAEGHGAQHQMKMALFAAHFTEGRDVNDTGVLTDLAAAVGLDPSAAKDALDGQTHAAPVRQKQQFWIQQGVQGVPAMVFNQKYLVTGAQGAEGYASALTQLAQGAA